MAYPDLYRDELKILEAQNIKVKSVPFTAILTNRRLILVDTRKQKQIPVQEILLATLKNVDSGENAIRDAILTLSIITNTGTTRQMILTFSKTSGGERKRECDEWVRALRQHVSQNVEYHPIQPDTPALAEEEPVDLPVISHTPPPSNRIEIVNAPPQKKRIEISRPMKKIIESPPAMPKPIETSSLPTGSFCNRCGSRVPAESAFCNRCGTPVAKESELDALLRQPVSSRPAIPQESPAPALEQVAVPLPPVFGQADLSKERPLEEVMESIEPLFEGPEDSPHIDVVEHKPVEIQHTPKGSFCNRCGNHVPAESTFCNRCGTPVVKEPMANAAPISQPVITPLVPPQEPPAPAVPQVAVPLPPVFGQATEKKERPIEQVIHSIEPLIEGSVPRTEPAPLVPKPGIHHVPEPVVPAAEPAPAPDSPVQWPVITPPVTPPAPVAAAAPVTDVPVPPAAPGGSSGRGKMIAIAILAIVIIAAIAGVFLFANPLHAGPGTPATPTETPTVVPSTTIIPVTTAIPVTTEVPAVTTAAQVQTPAPTVASVVSVPKSGVWVQITYKNKFSGSVGTPNSQREISDTGDKVYQISTSTGTVTASVQKLDGSGDELSVAIYKDGELIRKKSTVAPKGVVELQEDLKPAPTPTPTPSPVITPAPTATTSTPVVNTTASG